MLINNAEWLEVPSELNSFWIFGKSFFVENQTEAILEIASDKDMEIWLNGNILECAQQADLPGTKSFSCLNISLNKGDNLLKVQIFNPEFEFMNYNNHGSCHGLAAIIYDNDGKIICKTDESWLYARNEAYIPVADTVSPQLGFCFEYDARKATDWQYSQPEGIPAVISKWQPKYEQRSVAPLVTVPEQSTSIVQAGWFIRTRNNGTCAEQCSYDFTRATFLDEVFKTDTSFTPASTFRTLTPTSCFAMNPAPAGTNGAYVIVDLGRETVGFLSFNIEAPEGTVIDIAHGEHLDDGRVRSSIAGRNFADRFICKDGINKFTHRLRRFGARYLEFHILSNAEGIKFGFATLLEQALPLSQESEFNCEDSRLLALRRVAIDTLKCCMHEHYEDCPWREQSLYAYDSRNQALYGYQIWGNYEFAKYCFNLLGDNYMGNGQIAITAPREHTLAIESFSLVWVTDIYELYLHSGDASVLEYNRDTIFKILDSALERKDPETGLYEQYDNPLIWTFFEWVDGLSGSRGLQEKHERLHACFNAYLLESLQHASKMYNGKYDKEVKELTEAIRRYFWNNDGYFLTTDNEHYVHQHTQALMLMTGVATSVVNDDFFKTAYINDRLVRASFSSMPYILPAWMEFSPESRKAMEELVFDQYGSMLDKGATTFWETIDGGDAFYYAGSLCHAWSSLPILYCHKYVLGVTPVEPGFKKFIVRPYPGRLTHASGSVPTPYGDIKVSWKLVNGMIQLAVDHPAETELIIEQYPEFPVAGI